MECNKEDAASSKRNYNRGDDRYGQFDKNKLEKKKASYLQLG